MRGKKTHEVRVVPLDRSLSKTWLTTRNCLAKAWGGPAWQEKAGPDADVGRSVLSKHSAAVHGLLESIEV